MLANERRKAKGEGKMRPTASLGVMALVFAALLLECLGAGAYFVSSAYADTSDFCFGYAICQ
jgi:hypothetical protein